MYHKITTNKQIAFSDFYLVVRQYLFSPKTIIYVLSFTILNWLFEILKWQNLVAVVQKISFSNALKQSLSSLTASLITPNRIGEYGVKAIYYPKESRNKVMLLNLVSNLTQMIVTVFFGLVGVVYLFQNYAVRIPLLVENHWYYWMFLIVLLLLSYLFLAKYISNLYSKIIVFLKEIPFSIVKKTVVFSIIRYVLFSHQFYYLLTVFQIDLDYFIVMKLVYSMYLIASIIPSLPMFDWLVKGSVSVLVFHFVGINELIILSITTLMWLCNFALPSIIGSYYVLKFKYLPSQRRIF